MDAPQVQSMWWTVVAVIVWVIAAAEFAFALAGLSQSINSALIGLHGRAVVTLSPTRAWWYLYSAAAALACGWHMASPVLRVLMSPSRFAEWERQQFEESGFSPYRASHLLTLGVLLPSTACFIPSLGCHTRFSESEIAIQEYMTLTEHVYSYQSVERVVFVRGFRGRDGKFQPQPHLVIRFADGRLWTSYDGFRDAGPVDKELLALLNAKSRCGVTTIESDPVV